MNNFAIRTITSVVFTAVMVAGLIFDGSVFGALFLIIMLVAMREFYSMALGSQYVLGQRLAMLSAAIFLTTTVLFCQGGLEARWILLGILPLMAKPVVFVFMKQRPEFGRVAYLYAGLLYIALPICLSPFIVYGGNGGFNGFLLLSIFIVIWLCDVGAYCVGSVMGQKPGAKKLAPSISPKKSWWGFWGGVFFGTLAGVVLHFVGWIPFSLVHSIVLGALISVCGVCGDLFESLWKRWFDVKDSGNCIPGHGGMLDRFDSSLMAIPVALAYIVIFGIL